MHSSECVVFFCCAPAHYLITEVELWDRTEDSTEKEPYLTRLFWQTGA